MVCLTKHPWYRRFGGLGLLLLSALLPSPSSFAQKARLQILWEKRPDRLPRGHVLPVAGRIIGKRPSQIESLRLSFYLKRPDQTIWIGQSFPTPEGRFETTITIPPQIDPTGWTLEAVLRGKIRPALPPAPEASEPPSAHHLPRSRPGDPSDRSATRRPLSKDAPPISPPSKDAPSQPPPSPTPPAPSPKGSLPPANKEGSPSPEGSVSPERGTSSTGRPAKRPSPSELPVPPEKRSDFSEKDLPKEPSPPTPGRPTPEKKESPDDPQTPPANDKSGGKGQSDDKSNHKSDPRQAPKERPSPGQEEGTPKNSDDARKEQEKEKEKELQKRQDDALKQLRQGWKSGSKDGDPSSSPNDPSGGRFLLPPRLDAPSAPSAPPSLSSPEEFSSPNNFSRTPRPARNPRDPRSLRPKRPSDPDALQPSNPPLGSKPPPPDASKSQEPALPRSSPDPSLPRPATPEMPGLPPSLPSLPSPPSPSDTPPNKRAAQDPSLTPDAPPKRRLVPDDPFAEIPPTDKGREGKPPIPPLRRPSSKNPHDPSSSELGSRPRSLQQDPPSTPQPPGSSTPETQDDPPSKTQRSDGSSSSWRRSHRGFRSDRGEGEGSSQEGPSDQEKPPSPPSSEDTEPPLAIPATPRRPSLQSGTTNRKEDRSLKQSEEAQADRRTTSTDIYLRQVFTPYMPQHDRLSVFDKIREDYGIVSSSTRKQILSIGGMPVPERQHFVGRLRVILLSNAWTPLPSVGPDIRILSYASQPRKALIFAADGLGRLFVRPARRKTGTIELMFSIDTPKEYFGGEIPAGIYAHLYPRLSRPFVPSVVRSTVLRHLGEFGLSYRMDLRNLLMKLVPHLRSFSAKSLNEEEKVADYYLTLMRKRAGVCRHRASLFVITLQSLGYPARMIANNAHSFAEVGFPDGGWRLIDLGGADVSNWVGQWKGQPYQPPPDPFPVPKVDESETREEEEAHRRSSPTDNRPEAHRSLLGKMGVGGKEIIRSSPQGQGFGSGSFGSSAQKGQKIIQKAIKKKRPSRFLRHLPLPSHQGPTPMPFEDDTEEGI